MVEYEFFLRFYTEAVFTSYFRIVNVSSALHRLGPSSKLGIMWDDMNQEKKYDSDRCYSQSKLANILHAMELAKRLKDSGIVAFSLHPGNNAIKKSIYHYGLMQFVVTNSRFC